MKKGYLISAPLRLLSVASSLTIASAASAQAADSGAAQKQYNFTIPQQNTAAALQTFAAQSRVQILFPHEAARVTTSQAVKGRMTRREALARLLQGTTLSVASDTGTTIVLRSATPAPTPAPAPAPAPASIDAEAPEATDSSQGLQDIIVTAERRSGSLQKTAISVSAVPEERLDALRLVGTDSLQFAVPTLVYQNLTGYAQPTLRGVGPGLSSPNVDPPVATYIDGAFVADSQSTIMGLLGVKQVEVLAGPQGTLFGRNAMGGAINITTLSPTQDFEARAKIGFGNLDSREISGSVSGGVSKTLALGIYAGASKRDTFYTYTVQPRPTSEPEGPWQWGVRVKAVFTPSDRVSFNLSAERTRSNTNEANTERNIQEDASGYAYGAPKVIEYHLATSDFANYFRSSQHSVTLRSDFDFDWAKLVTISNYRRSITDSLVDLDGTSANVLNAGLFPGKNRQYSQEIQLLSPDSSPIRWIVGAYYFNQYGGYFPVRTLIPPFDLRLDQYNNARTRSWAGFGQADFPIGEKFKITAGGRYTVEKKRFRGLQETYNNAGTLIATTDYVPGEKTWKEFTPKLALNYQANRDVLIYASYSRGFTSGAFNLSGPPPGGPPIDPQTIDAYEIGLKSDLFDRRVRFNLAGYHYDLKDVQVQAITGTSGLTTYSNAASSDITGIEATLEAIVTDHLRFTAQGAWQSAKYALYPNAPGVVPNGAGNTSILVDATGNRLERAPKWVGSTTLSYQRETVNGGKIDGNVSAYYNGGFYWDPTNELRQPSYFLLRGSIGYTFPSPNVTVTLWGSNLTNKKYGTVVFTTGFGTIQQDAEPRLYGLTLSYKY